MSSKLFLQLIEKRTLLLNELSSLPRLLHGSWVERYSVCSRKGCKCRSGVRHGPRYYVVVNLDGHQRQKYVPIAQVPVAKEGIAQYHRLQEIVEEITQINLALIKESPDEDS
ncbi:MAG: hypothetical protein NTZ74_09760 [Chloroflexi bacterium]|nr:hypothetical protein [Chloroflexota bacterium]